MRSDHSTESDKSAYLSACERLLKAAMEVEPSDQSTEATPQHLPHPMVVIRGDLKRGGDILEALRLQSQTQKHTVWAKAAPQVVKYVGRALVGVLIAVSALSAEVRTAVAGLVTRDGTKPTPTSPPPTTDPGQALAPFIKSSLRT